MPATCFVFKSTSESEVDEVDELSSDSLCCSWRGVGAQVRRTQNLSLICSQPYTVLLALTFCSSGISRPSWIRTLLYPCYLGGVTNDYHRNPKFKYRDHLVGQLKLVWLHIHPHHYSLANYWKTTKIISGLFMTTLTFSFLQESIFIFHESIFNFHESMSRWAVTL